MNPKTDEIEWFVDCGYPQTTLELQKNETVGGFICLQFMPGGEKPNTSTPFATCLPPSHCSFATIPGSAASSSSSSSATMFRDSQSGFPPGS